jgi:hypothetical protein
MCRARFAARGEALPPRCGRAPETPPQTAAEVRKPPPNCRRFQARSTARNAAEKQASEVPLNHGEKPCRSAAEFWGEALPRTGTSNAAADVPPKCRPMIERSTPKRRRQTAARPSAKHGAERRRQSAAKPSAKPCRPSAAAAQRGARRKPPTNRRRFRARSTAANWFLTHATMQSAPPLFSASLA